MKKSFIVTIDGPNAVGKTAAAQCLAKLMNYRHLNTGAIYRALAYVSLKNGHSSSDADEIIGISEKLQIDFPTIKGQTVILVNGKNLTKELYTAEVLSFTAEMAKIAEIREALLPVQRKQADKGGIVVDGRDSGTIVFPDAEWKFYFNAAEWKRAKTMIELLSEEEKKLYPTMRDVIQYLDEIDAKDMTRAISPLKPHKDAIFLDTTYSLSPEYNAHILHYYITCTKEITNNSLKLKKKYRQERNVRI